MNLIPILVSISFVALIIYIVRKRSTNKGYTPLTPEQLEQIKRARDAANQGGGSTGGGFNEDGGFNEGGGHPDDPDFGSDNGRDTLRQEL